MYTSDVYTSPLVEPRSSSQISTADYRRLQSGGGFSIEIAAIVATVLIGMVGYVVQAAGAVGAEGF